MDAVELRQPSSRGRGSPGCNLIVPRLRRRGSHDDGNSHSENRLPSFFISLRNIVYALMTSFKKKLFILVQEYFYFLIFKISSLSRSNFNSRLVTFIVIGKRTRPLSVTSCLNDCLISRRVEIFYANLLCHEKLLGTVSNQRRKKQRVSKFSSARSGETAWKPSLGAFSSKTMD